MYKKIPGLVGYSISYEGQVYSDKSNKILSPWRNNRGRTLVTFSVDGTNKSYLVSRLVCFVYGDLPSLDSTLEVDHIDGNPDNNSACNLQALTSEVHLEKTLGGLVKGPPKCNNCGGPKSDHRASNCMKCIEIKSPEITVKDIEYWVSHFSWVRAAKELGMSDNGLRKRYKALTGNDPKSIKKVSQLPVS